MVAGSGRGRRRAAPFDRGAEQALVEPDVPTGADHDGIRDGEEHTVTAPPRPCRGVRKEDGDRGVAIDVEHAEAQGLRPPRYGLRVAGRPVWRVVEVKKEV